METRTSQDEIPALTQGWNVFEIWDDRAVFEIQKNDASKIFLTDEAARDFVRNRQHDPLCKKASVLVFISKIGAIQTEEK